MVFSKIVEPGLVVALEGNGYNAAVGKRNVESNGIENLRVIHGAAGGTSGTISFSENWNGEVNSGSPEVGSVASALLYRRRTQRSLRAADSLVYRCGGL
jgi:hypothetical protein